MHWSEQALDVRAISPNVTLSPRNGTDPQMGMELAAKVFVPPFESRDFLTAQSEGCVMSDPFAGFVRALAPVIKGGATL
jgi:hypothetical protein